MPRFYIRNSPLLLAVATILFAGTVSSAQSNFSSLSKKADAARDADHLDEAAALYQRALGLKPSWKEGWWSLGTIYYDQDKFTKAVQAFRTLVKTDPANGTGYAMLGLCQFELGQDEASLGSIHKGLSLGLLKDQALRNVVLYHEGLLLLRQRKFGAAQEALSLLVSYGAAGEQSAEALGMAVLGVRPQELPSEGTKERIIITQAGRAEVLGVQKKFEEGGRIYSSTISAAADFPGLHFAYGRFLLAEHLTDEAIAEFKREIENHPKHVQSYLQIASVQYQLNSAEGAKYAREAVNLRPEFLFAHYMLGLLLVDTADYANGIAELELAAKGRVQEADLYYALGQAYARVGRKADAVRARATFKQLSAEASKHQDEPNIYGEQRPLRVSPDGSVSSGSEKKP